MNRHMDRSSEHYIPPFFLPFRDNEQNDVINDIRKGTLNVIPCCHVGTCPAELAGFSHPAHLWYCYLSMYHRTLEAGRIS